MLSEFMVIELHIPEKDFTTYERSFLIKVDVALGHHDHGAKCILTKIGDSSYNISFASSKRRVDKLFESKDQMISYLKMLKESV